MEVAGIARTSAPRIDDLPMNRFLRKIIVFSSGGAFLDGYVLSIIGVALVQATTQLHLSDSEVAATGAASLAGIFFGSLAGGYFTDRFGRRVMFIIDISAIGLASVLALVIDAGWQLLVLRLLLGFFIGADYPIATSLIAEFTPISHRSVGMGLVAGAWYLGATAAAFIGWLLYDAGRGWRWMLASAVIPCIALLIGRHDIPESPRWLARRGQLQQAHQVAVKVFGVDASLDDEEVPDRRGVGTILRGGYLVRVLYLGVLVLCQVVPMYAIYTFGPRIMGALGLEHGRSGVLGEAVVSLLFLLGTFPAIKWLDSLGRRPLLIGSLGMMTVGLMVLGIWPHAPILVVLLGFGTYAFFSGGPGILQWLYPNELFPTEVRATAVGVAIAISRIGVVVSTYGLPIFLQHWGIGPTMCVGAGLLLLALILSLGLAPETRGRPLEQTSSLEHPTCSSPTGTSPMEGIHHG